MKKFINEKLAKPVTNFMHLESSLVRTFFKKLSLNNEACDLTLALKIMSTAYCLEVVGSCMAYKSGFWKQCTALTFTVLTLIVLLIFIRRENFKYLRSVSIFIIVSAIGYNILLCIDMMIPFEISYTPIIVITILMFCFCNLGVQLSLAFAIVYFIIFLSLVKYRLLDTIADTNITEVKSTSIFLSKWRIISKPMINFKNQLVIGQSVLLILTLLVGLYLKISHNIFRKSMYKKLIKIIKLKASMKLALRDQDYWLEIIMPKFICRELQRDRKEDGDFNFFYCKHFKDVSVICTMVLGLDVHSNQTESFDFVSLLNDLLKAFDKAAKSHNAEQIESFSETVNYIIGGPGTNNDNCYSAIHLGTALFQAVKRHNQFNDSNLNVKIGIHFGSVNMAVIGMVRWKFNVYGCSLLTAKDLCHTCQINKVRITQIVKDKTIGMLEVENAPDLRIGKIENYGISGIKVGNETVRTYFVLVNQDRRFSWSRKSFTQSEIFKLPINVIESSASILLEESTILDQSNDFSISSSHQGRQKVVIDKEIDKDLILIEKLKTDPDDLLHLIKRPILQEPVLFYLDRKMENHFRRPYNQPNIANRKSSIFLLLIYDSTACILFFSIFLLVALVLFPINSKFIYQSIVIYFSGLIIVIAIVVQIVFHDSDTVRSVLKITCHPLTRIAIVNYLSSLPTILVLFIQSSENVNNYSSVIVNFTLLIFSFVCHMIYTVGFSISRQILSSVTLFFTVPYYLKILKAGFDASLGIKCLRSTPFIHRVYTMIIKGIVVPQLFLVIILIIFVTRLNEKNLRGHFLVSNEHTIKVEEERKMRYNLNMLIENVFPRFVLASFGKNTECSMSYKYSQTTVNAGILFGNVTNFFSSYYREDYKQGEESIKLLHQMICLFDRLLMKEVYDEIEKIKSCESGYLLVSGINPSSNDSKTIVHLQKLMDLAFDMNADLRKFNDEFIIGFDGFELDIGFFVGTVTAGVITTSKTRFDVWGDSIKKTILLSEKGKNSSILTTESVKLLLNNSFKFVYNSKVYYNQEEIKTYKVLAYK